MSADQAKQDQIGDGATAQARLVESARAHLTGNYRQAPIVMERGDGRQLFDVTGKRYLDMTAGIAVNLLGHSHPKLTAAIAAQAGKLIHCSNLYFIEPQVRLAEKLAALSGFPRMFFGNSGAEANEAALKLARRYQQHVAAAPGRIEIVACHGSFHGRTMATVSITGQEKYRQGFGPMLEAVRFVPYGDLDAARAAISQERTCAFVLEPLQGEGGVRVPPPGYLRGLRELCGETGTILIYDEVQTGVGRTGEWFAFQHAEGPGQAVQPDIMTLAKGLAGGVPIGAMLCSDEVAKGFEPGTHASTFGGNALASAAALAVLDVIESEGLLAHVRAMGEHLGRGLERLCAEHPGKAKEARGKGLLRGLALAGDAVPTVTACREQGLLLSVAGGTVVRFAPALNVTAAELDEALALLGKVLAA